MSEPRRGLRRRLRERRNTLPAAARIAAAESFAERAATLPALQQGGYVAGYWAVAGELSLHALLPRLPAGCLYCLPQLHADGRLRFAPWRLGDPLVANRYGIPEPDVEPASCLDAGDLRAALLPLLGFDRRGHRLGMGGGWYDRSFAFRRETAAPPHLIGVGYAFQEIEGLAAAAWDVPLDLVATEREIIVCAG